MKEIYSYRVKLVKENTLQYESVKGISSAIGVFRSIIGEEAQEVLSIITMTTNNKPVGYFEVTRGSDNASMFDIREIVKRVLLSNANQFIIAHNHPSGSVKPSSADIEATNALKDACRLLNIKLLDHIIVSDNDHFSFKAYGYID